MTNITKFFIGARPETWVNALCPVIAGLGSAYGIIGFHCDRATLVLLVLLSLGLVISVNFANDYADGVKGLDSEDRTGKERLVGSGLASAEWVRNVAIASTVVSAIIGLFLCWHVQSWFLLVLGVICVALAWGYTSGPKPLAYHALGEATVFLVFGLIAVLGSQYALAHTIDITGVLAACAVGSFSAAMLLVNNLRDIPSDKVRGKNTIAVKIGEENTRSLYLTLLLLPFALAAGIALRFFAMYWEAIALIPAHLAYRPVAQRYRGAALISSLQKTGITMLVWSVIYFLVMWTHTFS